MTTLAEARRKSPVHNGRNNIVRAELVRAGKPLSVYKLHLATGLKADPIRAALQGLMQIGDVVAVKGPKNITFYTIYKVPEKRAEPSSGRVAGRIVTGRGSYWGAGLV